MVLPGNSQEHWVSLLDSGTMLIDRYGPWETFHAKYLSFRLHLSSMIGDTGAWSLPGLSKMTISLTKRLSLKTNVMWVLVTLPEKKTSEKKLYARVIECHAGVKPFERVWFTKTWCIAIQVHSYLWSKVSFWRQIRPDFAQLRIDIFHVNVISTCWNLVRTGKNTSNQFKLTVWTFSIFGLEKFGQQRLLQRFHFLGAFFMAHPVNWFCIGQTRVSTLVGVKC